MISNPAHFNPLQRLHLTVQGTVQGVGFRPFVYRLATELNLGGWISNSDRGVEIEVEGAPSTLEQFLERLECDRPPQATLTQIQRQVLPLQGPLNFEIRPSQAKAALNATGILPDLATCPDCLREIFDPKNRRYRYPFTNCTNCGPRYSILTALPYDRPHTTMQAFRMCEVCQQEYEDPRNRRFHAQPNACPNCGPQLKLRDAQGQPLQTPDTTDLIGVVGDRIRQGQIVALKGLGGFHLLVDARSEAAVQRLRDRKQRPTKPLAVMYPSLAAVHQDYQVSPGEAELLTAAAAPIVLLTRQPDTRLAAAVAPHLPTVGVMLPYTPLHHLLLAHLDFPVVATSGNPAQSPICIDNHEALQHLGHIADLFVMHNRPIARAVDDSVVRLIQDYPLMLRRSRGYTPSPLPISESHPPFPCVLAVGGHLKNTVALSLPGQVVVSQHLGDLSDVQTVERFQQAIAQLLHLYRAHPVAIACDAHPDYVSTQFAQCLSTELAVPLLPIQHHQAHILATMFEHRLAPPVLGIAWDGTGYGLDGTSWGGEFLAMTHPQGFDRVAHLRPFPLPGGDRAAREPWRSALGLLYAAFGEPINLELPFWQTRPDQTRKLLQMMLKRGLNSPYSSSIGRLFDAIAALISLCQVASFEGEAAIHLESVTAGIDTRERYPYCLVQHASGSWVLDWEPTLIAILADRQSPPGIIAAKFHNALIDALVAIALRIGIPQVVLTGGCFQNRYLLEGAIRQLRAAGLQPYWPQQMPPNDGGLALGQIFGAAGQLAYPAQGGFSCA